MHILTRFPDWLQVIAAWAVGIAICIIGITLYQKSQKEFK